MNLGEVSIITAGLLWLASASVLLEVSRVLGPSFHTKATVHRGWRALAWLGAVAMFGRGMTFLFPGQLVEFSRGSVMAPLGAIAVLGVTIALLDLTMRDRSPPPWSVQVMRLVALIGKDGPIRFAALALPPAPAGAAIPLDDVRPPSRSRLPVLAGSTLVIVSIAVFLAVSSQAGTPS